MSDVYDFFGRGKKSVQMTSSCNVSEISGSLYVEGLKSKIDSWFLIGLIAPYSPLNLLQRWKSWPAIIRAVIIITDFLHLLSIFTGALNSHGFNSNLRDSKTSRFINNIN